MRNGIFPIFTKGRVLKKESVEYLRDFPYDMASLVCGDHSDGILLGFSVSSEDERIFVSKGALKYRGNIIVVPESSVITPEYERLMFIKLVIGKYSETEDYIICPIEIKIDENEPLSDNEMELGRFCLSQGAALRCVYDSFADLRTPENTLDITHVCYAGAGEATLHPRVLKEFARALIASSSDTVDTAFAMICLNAGVINKSTIQCYIAKKNNIGYTEYATEELYGRLAEALPQFGRKQKQHKPRGKGPIII